MRRDLNHLDYWANPFFDVFRCFQWQGAHNCWRGLGIQSQDVVFGRGLVLSIRPEGIEAAAEQYGRSRPSGLARLQVGRRKEYG